MSTQGPLATSRKAKEVTVYPLVSLKPNPPHSCIVKKETVRDATSF